MQLLRPLLHLALRRRQLLPGIVELLLELRLVELGPRLFLSAHHRLALLNLGVHLLLDLERQGRLLILEPFPFLAQLELFVAERGDLLVACLEIQFLVGERLLQLLDPRRHRFFRQRANLRKRRSMRLALFREQPLQGFRFGLCRSSPLAGELLRALLDFGTLGIAKGRDRIRAGLLQPLQRFFREPLPKRKFMGAARTGDVDVQGQEQSMGAQRCLR